MYDPELVDPLRKELTDLGAIEMRKPNEVDEMLANSQGTILVVVNSVCGCAAGGCRPAVGLALKNAKRPGKVTTVFAGQDKEATERARTYFTGYPPSSPAMGLLKDGKLVHMITRQDIEGKSAEQIAENLKKAFETHC